MKRIYHTWDKWECYPSGFYEVRGPDRAVTDEEYIEKYRCFLSDIPQFEAAMQGVLDDWPNSCEHYLSNERMNRIAWLGQAAMCYATGVPSKYRGGYNQLNDAQKTAADYAALRFLNKFLAKHGEGPLSMNEAQSRTEANLY